ncbi:MAG: conjugal transfer protein TraO [Flavobacterium psychrophilum]|nr:MAG: conjugal transfer protein TraO [Flavobacterium psychrophilum]
MKKYITLFLLVISITYTRAQRMVYRQKAVEVNVGVLNDKHLGQNYYLGLGLNIFVRHGNYWMYSVEYQKQTTLHKNWEIPTENFFGEAGYNFRLLSDRKKFVALYAGLSVVGGYEVVNKGDSILRDGGILKNRDQLVYGTGGKLSIETYLSDRFVFLLTGRIRLLWGTDLEQLRPSSGIGLRFNF